jgi:PilZ domain
MSYPNGMQRRTKTRIQEPFRVTASGVDRKGQEFLTDGVLDNLSASGLYLCISHDVEEGGKLLVVIQLSSGDTGQGAAPRVAAHGKVLRSELKPDGRYGLAVEIKHHRFL